MKSESRGLMNIFNKILKVKAYLKEWKMATVFSIYTNKEKVGLG